MTVHGRSTDIVEGGLRDPRPDSVRDLPSRLAGEYAPRAHGHRHPQPNPDQRWRRNGDGHADVLVAEEGSGTAGCSLFKVLANEGRKVRQIYFEEACEANLAITEDSLLKVDEATYPRGCENIHGCGRRIQLLRWNGANWDPVRAPE